MTDAGISNVPTPTRTRPRVQPGLRLQIVLALAGLMLLAFVPLFFAVASLTRATILGAREASARALGRAIAAHVADAHASGGQDAIRHALAADIGRDDVYAVCAFASDGSPLACEGALPDVAAIRPPPSGGTGSVRGVRGAIGHALEVVSPGAGVNVVARVRVDAEPDHGASLVRLVALYMTVFALALLVFAYFALTRLIVRPVDQLAEATDRIASGARTLRFPRYGARELVDLGASVQAMAGKLISEEAALILKVEELTETTRRLTQAQAQLVRSERMASVGRLAAGVAHEIGNPIAALMGMQDLLLDGDLPAETERDFLQRMRKETERIHTVLRDLLDFARPEEKASQGSAPPAPADVRAVVDDVVSLVRPQKYFRDVRLETEIVGAPHVALPAPRLTQVLLNVILNAGAALASAGRKEGRVTIRARAEDAKSVRIEVEDNGPGIAQAVRDRLFEPFVTTKEVGEGTGLGLAVCRGLVESAGGEVGLDPSYSGGARFYVVLPAA
jgi:two-component system NtrC family sensor kinase